MRRLTPAASQSLMSLLVPRGCGGKRVENFTRLETFGDNAVSSVNDVQWVKVYVDPTSREVFSFQPKIVPANRLASPAP